MKFMIAAFLALLFTLQTAFSSESSSTFPSSSSTKATFYTEGECPSISGATCPAYLSGGNGSCSGSNPIFCCEEFIPRTQSSIQMGCYAAAPLSLFGGSCSTSSLCGTCVEVKYGTKTIYVQIVDACAGCDTSSHLLDLSPRAFCMLDDVSKGTIDVAVRAVPCGSGQFDSKCQLSGQSGSSESPTTNSTSNATTVAPPASKSCTCTPCPCSKTASA